MALKKAYKVGMAILCLLLIFGVIGWYYVYYRPRLYGFGEPIITGEPYPYLSNSGFQTVSDNPWLVRNFQPIVRGFLSENKVNYIIGEFEDKNGDIYTARIFITGRIDEEDYLESTYYYKNEDSHGLFSFDAIKQEIEVGSRIRVEYLSEHPEKNKQDCVEDLIYCQLAKVNKNSFGRLKTYEKDGIGSEDIVFPAFTIYSEIYEN